MKHKDNTQSNKWLKEAWERSLTFEMPPLMKDIALYDYLIQLRAANERWKQQEAFEDLGCFAEDDINPIAIMYDHGIHQIDRVIEQVEHKYYLMPWLHKGTMGTLRSLLRFPQDLKWSFDSIKDDMLDPFTTVVGGVLEAWGIILPKKDD